MIAFIKSSIEAFDLAVIGISIMRLYQTSYWFRFPPEKYKEKFENLPKIVKAAYFNNFNKYKKIQIKQFFTFLVVLMGYVIIKFIL